ncbi:ImmA/IrrE family metallo-endopeptidase [Paenibacillus sp. GXUN7292]|uniref:ImmA/IrrE family metallo-endopeptidase n=1 Tax=Paenibacillus sp. GXUN7292 TaxID=3422499 RepID=UPI003D7CB5BB
MLLNMNLYRPSDLERRIEKQYKSNDIYSCSDLTIKNVALAFDVDVEYYNGKPFADWINGKGIVVLNRHENLLKQREDFFHEVGHCFLHVGDQKKLNSLFIDLQEAQSLRFQYYAALPYFMILNNLSNTYDDLTKTLSESFLLPESFVRKRIYQINNRIQQELRDIDLKARLTPRPATYEYGEETKRILNQLNQQIAEKKGNYQVGY